MKKLSAVGVVLPALLLAAGCDKNVKLTFLNSSSESLDLKLIPPGKVMLDLGTLMANGGLIRYEVKVKEDNLPAKCFWRAGHHGGEILITKGSPKTATIEVRTGGPSDKRDVIKKKVDIDIKDELKDEGVVVE